MYKEKQLVGIAKRENNTQREKYLVVEPPAGKAYPSKREGGVQDVFAAQVRAAYAERSCFL